MLKRVVVVLALLLACVLAWVALREVGEAPPTGSTATLEEPDRLADVRSKRERAPSTVEPGAADETTSTGGPDTANETADDSAPKLRVTIRGKTSDAALAGARVRISSRGVPRTELRTDADGVAVLDPAPARGAWITAHAAAHVRGFVNLAPDTVRDAVASGESHVDVGLHLEPAVTLTGRVVDPDGRPLDGVRVDLDEGGTLDHVSVSSAGPLLGSAETGIDGTFAIDGALADDVITLRVTHRGFAHFERSLILPAEGASSPIEIRLAAGGSLVGVVRGPGHAPVEGATVVVAPSDAAHQLRNPDGAAGSARARQSSLLFGVSDADGRYRVDGLALDAPYEAVATLRGVGHSERLLDVAVRSDAPVSTLEIRLLPLHDLTIGVVDGAGAAIPGASVLSLTGRIHQLEPQADGHFRMSGLAPGDVVFDVDADGFIKRRVTHELTETAAIDVTLERGLSISGVAVNDLGEPLAGARIRCMRPLGDAYRDLPDSLADTQTDDEGRFTVGGLLGGPHAVLCWADGHGRGKLQPVDAGTQDVRVVAPRKATVTLELRLPPGAARPAKLMHEIKREGGGSGREQDWPGDDVLRVEVPPIPLQLIVLVDGYADVAFELELAAGEQRDLGRVVLGAGLTATGRITDPSGRPVPQASITATPPWAFDGRRVRADASGRFRLPRLAPALHDVRVEADGFLTLDLERDTADSLEWNIVLARGGLVRGTIRSPEGIGVTEGTIWLLPTDAPESESDDRTEITYPENDGRYELRAPAGTYRVEFRPQEGDPIHVGSVKLAEGSTEELDLVVAK